VSDDKPPSNPDAPATPADWAAMTFEPIIIDAAAFGPAWDKARGDLARAIISLLRHDDKELTRRCTVDEHALEATVQMYEEIEKEIDYLETHIAFLHTALTRLLCVTARYEAEHGDIESDSAQDVSTDDNDPA
jgi:hypothetical protein